MRKPGAKARQAYELQLLQYHRRLRPRQVPPMSRLLSQVWGAQNVWAVQAEVCLRQGRQEGGRETAVLALLTLLQEGPRQDQAIRSGKALQVDQAFFSTTLLPYTTFMFRYIEFFWKFDEFFFWKIWYFFEKAEYFFGKLFNTSSV